MMYAKIGGERRVAHPGLRGVCAQCDGVMLAKCGAIKAWHWAHQHLDCDPWHSEETAWHLAWKQRYPTEWVEVPLGPHRADIKTPSYVIELQHSALSPTDICAREAFYGRMVWILDALPFLERLSFTDRGEYCGFRWKHARVSWRDYAKRPLIFDFGTLGLFEVRRLSEAENGHTIGYGCFIDPSGLLLGAPDWQRSRMQGRPPLPRKYAPGVRLEVSLADIVASLPPVPTASLQQSLNFALHEVGL